MSLKTNLVRSTAAVDSKQYFEKGFPLNKVLILFHPKTFESVKRLKHEFFSDF